MNKSMQIWVEDSYFVLGFCKNNKTSHYYHRPISSSFRLGEWVLKLRNSGNYLIRAFAGGAFGLVIENRGK